MNYAGRSMEPSTSNQEIENALVNCYGAISGVQVGDSWHQRRELIDSKVHKSRSRIDVGEEGPYSILLTGVRNINDQGYTFVFSSGELEKVGDDEEPERAFNKSMMQAYHSQNPFRVVRGSYLKSPYSPKEGFRYDGLYVCQSFAKEAHSNGKYFIKFVASRRLGEPMAPWLYDKSDFRPIVLNSRCIRLQRPLTTQETADKARYEAQLKNKLIRVKKELAATEEVVEIVSEQPREIQIDEALALNVVIEESMSLEGTEFVEDDENLYISFSAAKKEESSLEEIDLVEEEDHFQVDDSERAVAGSESSEGDGPQPVTMFLVNSDEEDVVVMKHSPTSGLVSRQEPVYYLNSPLRQDQDPLSVKSPMSQMHVATADTDPIFHVRTLPLPPCVAVPNTIPVIKPPLSVQPVEEVSDGSDECLYKQEDHDYSMPEWFRHAKKTPSPPLVCCTCHLSAKRPLNSILGPSKADLFHVFHQRYFCTCGASTVRSLRYKNILPKLHALLKQLWSNEPLDVVKLFIFTVTQMQQAKDEPQQTNERVPNSGFQPTNPLEPMPSQVFCESTTPLMTRKEVPQSEDGKAVYMILQDILTKKLYNLEEHNNSFRLSARLDQEPISLKQSEPGLPISLDIEDRLQRKTSKAAPAKATPDQRKFPGRKRGPKRKEVLSPPADVPEKIPCYDNLDYDQFFGACEGLIESVSRTVVRSQKASEPVTPAHRKPSKSSDFRFNLLGFKYHDIKRSAKNLQHFLVKYPYDDDDDNTDLYDGYTSGEIQLAEESVKEFKDQFRGYKKNSPNK